MKRILLLALLLSITVSAATLSEVSCTPTGEISQSGVIELDFQCRIIVDGEFSPVKAKIRLLSDRNIVRNKNIGVVRPGQPNDFEFKVFLKDKGLYHMIISLDTGETMISQPLIVVKKPKSSTWYNLTIATVITIGVSAAIIIGYSAWTTRQNKIHTRIVAPAENY